MSALATSQTPGTFRVVDALAEPAEALSARLARQMIAEIDALEAVVAQLEQDIRAGAL